MCNLMPSYNTNKTLTHTFTFTVYALLSTDRNYGMVVGGYAQKLFPTQLLTF